MPHVVNKGLREYDVVSHSVAEQVSWTLGE